MAQQFVSIEQFNELVKEVNELRLQINGSVKAKKEPESDQWSMETSYNNIFIKFSTNEQFNEFKNFIKELGGTWYSGKKAWKFPLLMADQIIERVSEAFSTFEFIDLRN